MSDADATLTASRALLGVIARSLAEVLDTVTPPQFRILVVLTSSGPMRMGLLAEQMGVLPSTFSRSIDRMVAQGWVERSTSPESRREILLDVTPAGRALVDTVTEQRRNDIRRILRNMSPDDRRTLLTGLDAFSAAAGEPSSRELLTIGI